MEDLIEYSSTEQQLQKLKDQNLVIEDDNRALKMLEAFGYFNLIKSYRNPYIVKTQEGITYRSGVTFNQIYSLYKLDKNLRNAVMASMQDLEENIKEAAADVIARSFGVEPFQYLEFRKYQNKRKSKPQFTLTGLLESINKTLKTDKNPIKHYRTEHGIIPPWILFKSVYFSTIINFIDQFKNKEQMQLVSHLYDVDKIKINSTLLPKLMMDTLFICLDYRNRAAHGGRIYNYESNHNLRKEEIFGQKVELSIAGFSELLFLLNIFSYKNPYLRLNAALQDELTRHCTKFPQDVTYLGQILNIDIIEKNMVYISEKNNKYHFNQHCSGMKNAKAITIEQANDGGYIPCKRCCE